MTSKLVSGVFAAVLTPRQADGALDLEALRNNIQFLLDRGIRGFALNGATGEYCLTSMAELQMILAVARETTSGEGTILCGVGSADLAGSVARGLVAKENGAQGLLLPPPHFFPYEQDDIECFCREVARTVPLPILLYQLPQFTSGFERSTVERLLTDCPNIVGIKDSSGSLDLLRGLTACRVVGNDVVLAEALREGICDGVISGIAGVAPELVQAVVESSVDSDEFRKAKCELTEFIGRINGLPNPWGLKWIAEARGIAPARFSQPLSEHRERQGRALQEWWTGGKGALSTE